MNFATSRSRIGINGTREAGERSCDTTRIGSKFVPSGLEESPEDVTVAIEGCREGELCEAVGVRAMLDSGRVSAMVRVNGREVSPKEQQI